MSESTRTLSGPAAPPLSDDVLEQVAGGVQAPRDPTSGQSSGFTIDYPGGRIAEAKAGKPQSALCNNEIING